MRSVARRSVVVALLVAFAVPGAASAKKPAPPPVPPPSSSTATFVKNFADVVSGVQVSATPEDVQATADGGTIALASVPSPDGVLVNWFTKLSTVGAIQWQEEVVCLLTAPGDYSIGVSLQLTSDGGYALAGGTIGCGSGANCPVTSGLTCGFVEKLTSTGAVSWARVYTVGADGTVFNEIRQTSDGGYVAVGSATDANNNSGGLAVKLDANGNLVWQSIFGSSSASQADFQSVAPASGVGYGLRQTSDGGFVLAGDANIKMNDGAPIEPWLAKVDSAGQLVWQENVYRVNPQTGRPLSENFAGVTLTPAGIFALGFTENVTSGKGELLGVSTDSLGQVASTCADVHSAGLLAAANPGLVNLNAQLAVTTSTGAGVSNAPVATLTTSGTASAAQC